MIDFESKEQQDFENFMMRYKPEFRDFDKVDDFTYSNTLTGIAYDSYLQGIKSQQAKIDELQARIDATEKWIESNKKTIALGYIGYTTEEYVDADDLLDILKGNKDEK